MLACRFAAVWHCVRAIRQTDNIYGKANGEVGVKACSEESGQSEIDYVKVIGFEEG